MFCTQCGSALPADSRFCPKCGHPTVMAGSAATAPDSFRPAPTANTTRATSPALWNPNAAGCWSILFSPAFGAYLHMRNWQALGESQRAETTKKWFYAALVMLGVYIVLAVITANNKSADGFLNVIGFVFLLTWYFSDGNKQAPYVKARFGAVYLRRGWGKPILIGLGCVIVYVAVAAIIGAAFIRTT